MFKFNNKEDDRYKEAAEFWEAVYPQGFTESDIENELVDFYELIEKTRKLVCHVTGGRLSKAGYPLETIIDEADEHFNNEVKTALEYEQKD